MKQTPAKHTEDVIARGTSLPISTKYSVEICREIRNKPLKKAQRLLEDVLIYKRAIPIKRFTLDLGHKPGMAAATYPHNASRTILDLLHLLAANAEHKGYNPDKLIITHAVANKAERRWHYGRQQRTKMKSTHIELRARETTENKQ